MKENCFVEYSGASPYDNLMEHLLPTREGENRLMIHEKGATMSNETRKPFLKRRDKYGCDSIEGVRTEEGININQKTA